KHEVDRPSTKCLRACNRSMLIDMCVLVWGLACTLGMHLDILEKLWRPECVLDMQPDMWSTRCRRACVRSHAKRHTGCHQPEPDLLVSPINTPRPQIISSHPDLSKLAPREGYVQLKVNQMKISSDGKQVNMAREGERNKVVDLECSRFSPRRPVPSNRRFYMIVTRKLCPNDFVLSRVSSYPRVLNSRSSTRYSAGKSEELSRSWRRFCPDQCVEACQFLHGETEVMSKSRSIQSSPVKASIGFSPSPLRLTSFLSAKNTVSRYLEVGSWHEAGVLSDLVTGGFKETPYSLDREDSDRRGHGLWLMTRRTVGCRAVTRMTVGRGRLKVALGKNDRIAGCWTLGPPVSWSKVCDSDRIVPSPSRSASGPWCWVGRSVMFLFDCWLAGWPFISNPWCGSSVGH
ncbi:hypothetical protein IGI04_014005, partial [Brassica rapa subsp. trilocularis]